MAKNSIKLNKSVLKDNHFNKGSNATSSFTLIAINRFIPMINEKAGITHALSFKWNAANMKQMSALINKK